jgi:hypothetical protein
MDPTPPSHEPPVPPPIAGYAPQASSPEPPPAPPVPSNGLAIASLVCGILGFMMCFPAIGAIVCGHLARSQIKANPTQSGDGLALAGLITGYVVLGMGVLGIIAYFVMIIVFVGAAGSATMMNVGP